ncbi:hypothetical protein DL546_004907 [Coniochaeta pulveracea]|uniref:Prenyltransferase alpha-alpha toroid domain-containing protein n=1 Tax=Coniochaeta pulveracea TaxID=177199 RepID=A0A420YBL3_9PEZI|nr:hypothetical protein DL546_004907 [Coniochaeta pulveracea]
MADEPNDAHSRPLDKARHLKYWTRCLRSPLPHHYTPNDSNRIALAYFILSAIDLLHLSDPNSENDPKVRDSTLRLTPAERHRFRTWILSCQHAGGGFCGSPSMTLPSHSYGGWSFEDSKPTMGNPGQANIAATVFALILLALLADDETEACSAYSGVDRWKTLRWLRRLQRPDGSFGEILEEVEGKGLVIGGGKDMRYCYLAAMLRWMLRGDIQPGEPGWVEDIDVEGLVRYIGRSQTYDHGIAESSEHEPHSGYAYCAISALSLLDRPLDGGQHPHAALKTALPDMSSVVQWLVSRQFPYTDPEDPDNSEDEALQQTFTTLTISEPGNPVAFNGRCNKAADTCYCWWVCGALSVLPPLQPDGDNVATIIPRPEARRFILEKVQHIIGGFSKHPGGPPDLYHSYLGLAALATMGEPSLKEFDAALAVTSETAKKLVAARTGLISRTKKAGQPEGLGGKLLDMGVQVAGGKRPAWLEAL